MMTEDENLEASVAEMAKKLAPSVIQGSPVATATVRPRLPGISQLPASDFSHWTMTVNLILDNIERQGRTRFRFTDRDTEAMLQIKAWLDHQAT